MRGKKSWQAPIHICCCSVAKLCPTLCDPMSCSTPGFPILSHLRICSNSCPSSLRRHPTIHPLSSPSPPAFNLSQHQSLFQWVGSSHQVAKDWSFSFSISPSNEDSELISFRINWFELLTVQGTLESLFQHHSSKASILQHSAIFTVQLSHPHVTTEKNHSLDYIDLCW